MSATKTQQDKPKRYRKVFKDMRECCHVWASQRQDEGRAGNVFFHGKTIYSYGYHFPMASFVDEKHAKRLVAPGFAVPKVVLVTTRSYSVSTSKHQSYCRAAIPNDYECLYVQNACPNSDSEHKNNAAQILANAISLAESYRNSLKYGSSNSVVDRLQDLAKYVKLFRLTKLDKPIREAIKLAYNPNAWSILLSLTPDQIAAVNAKKERASERDAERTRINNEKREQQRLRQIEEDKELFPIALDKWRKGCSDYNTVGSNFRTITAILREHDGAFLRLIDDGRMVETSQHARISADTARRLWPTLKQRIVPSEDIDGYQATKWNGGDCLHIGCHKIPFSEMLYIAQQLGLESETQQDSTASAENVSVSNA